MATRKKNRPKPLLGNQITQRPAYGTYDPALDQQERAAGRGLEDLIADIGTANRRDTSDLELGKQSIDRSYGRSKDDTTRSFGRGREDLERDYTRSSQDLQRDFGRSSSDVQRQSGQSLADLLTARRRGYQDYRLATEERGRQYGMLANRQSQDMAARNVLGGAIQQAAEKRAANQQREQSLAKTDFGRFRTDNLTSVGRVAGERDLTLGRLLEDRNQTAGRYGEDRTRGLGRLGEDESTTLGRLNEDRSLGLADLQLGFGRRWEDRNAVQLPRAQRENEFYGQDINEIRIDQAKQAGLLPNHFGQPTVNRPKKPRKKGKR